MQNICEWDRQKPGVVHFTFFKYYVTEPMLCARWGRLLLATEGIG